MNPHDPVATILCGNLDFKPSEGPYQLLRDGVIKEATEQVFNAIDSATVSRGQVIRRLNSSLLIPPPPPPRHLYFNSHTNNIIIFSPSYSMIVVSIV